MEAILILMAKGERIAISDTKPIEIQPPRKIVVVKALISIIELYSAKKNKANPIAAYSTL